MLVQFSSLGDSIGDPFYAAPPDLRAKLPATGIYPRGRTMAYMGYSGEPARDLTNGFTVAGPVYGNQTKYLEDCFQHHWPTVAQIGPKIKFTGNKAQTYHLNEPQLRLQIQQQVQPLLNHPEIAWWAVTPEELRPWKADEMNYLAIVSDTIRRMDPLRRPIYLYNPNHRNNATLQPIARQVDILAKGCYVNEVGQKRNRAWVRWSMEQENRALAEAGRPGAIPLLMPGLSQDPEPGEDAEIRNWVRHDVYLGMASGAKGVLIWSLHKRDEVARTWQLWYDAYAECGRELNGTNALAQVFLFGQRTSSLQIKLLGGEAVCEFSLGGSAEPNTTSTEESARNKVKIPAITTAEFAHGNSRWLFLINSANTPATVSIAGWPKNSRAQNAFDHSRIDLPEVASMQIDLPPYGVKAFRFDEKAD